MSACDWMRGEWMEERVSEGNTRRRQEVGKMFSFLSCCQSNFMGIKAEKSDGNNRRLSALSIPHLTSHMDAARRGAYRRRCGRDKCVYSQQVQLHLAANQCILFVHQIEPALQVNLLVTFVF